MMRINSSRGFTLIELLVVISIIALLSSVVLGSLNSAREKGRLAASQKFATSLYRGFGADVLASWTFDEVNGSTIIDRSGNSIDLTFQNSAATAAGLYGNALSLNGSSYVTSSKNVAAPNPAVWTLSAWVKLNSFPSARALVLGTNSLPYIAITNTGTLHLSWYEVGNAQANIFTTATVSANKWHHVAFTSDGTKVTGYLDGREVIQNTSLPAATSVNVQGTAYLGYHPNAPTWLLNGLIDDANIFSQTLTASEIGNMYAQSLPKYLAQN